MRVRLIVRAAQLVSQQQQQRQQFRRKFATGEKGESSGRTLKDEVVVAAKLTPVGVFQRGLSSLSDDEVGSPSIKADGPGSGGPKDPPEVPSGQNKIVPEAAEDKRLWRKWIEERLSQPSSAGEETDASLSGNSRVGETVTRSRGPEDASMGKRFSPLDSIFRSALKPARDDGTAEGLRVSNLRNPFRRESVKSSFFPDRASNKNPSTGDSRSPLFQEAAKRPSFFSGRQAPSKGSQVSLNNLPVEALDDFEYRVLGSANDEDDAIDDDFLRDLDEIGRSARGMKNETDDDQDVGEEEDWSDDKAKVLTDLALSNMEMFDLEDEETPYRMRSDRLFFPGQTYDPEDLDLSKEAALEKPTVRTRKRYPSKEVLQVADFRNPRYLSKFMRETSRILPRRHYRISAKAQRKVAREIKTARILGLMPFTSMGDPPFKFLRSRSEDNTNARFDDY